MVCCFFPLHSQEKKKDVTVKKMTDRPQSEALCSILHLKFTKMVPKTALVYTFMLIEVDFFKLQHSTGMECIEQEMTFIIDPNGF